MTTTQNLTLTAPDISCAHCVGTIQREIGALPGVSQVDASFETKKVEIVFDPARLSRPQLEAAMDAAGYPVEPALA